MNQPFALMGSIDELKELVSLGEYVISTINVNNKLLHLSE